MIASLVLLVSVMPSVSHALCSLIAFSRLEKALVAKGGVYFSGVRDTYADVATFNFLDMWVHAELRAIAFLGPLTNCCCFLFSFLSTASLVCKRTRCLHIPRCQH